MLIKLRMPLPATDHGDWVSDLCLAFFSKSNKRNSFCGEQIAHKTIVDIL